MPETENSVILLRDREQSKKNRQTELNNKNKIKTENDDFSRKKIDKLDLE